jgi:hypothetical protein
MASGFSSPLLVAKVKEKFFFRYKKKQSFVSMVFWGICTVLKKARLSKKLYG